MKVMLLFLIIIYTTFPIISSYTDFETDLAITCATKFNNAQELKLNKYNVLLSFSKEDYKTIEFGTDYIKKNNEYSSIYWIENIAYEYYISKDNIINQWGAMRQGNHMVLLNCGVNRIGAYITGEYILKKQLVNLTQSIMHPIIPITKNGVSIY